MRDMTKSEPYGHLWRYALPLLLGNWLQLAYNAVDSIIAGRFIGQNALAAEGIAAPVMNLVILAISGTCIGAGVLMSEYFGAKNYGKLKKTMSTMLLCGADEVVRLGSEYLRVMAFFYLWPALTNAVQGFFRGMGKMFTTVIFTFVQASIRTVSTMILAPRMGIVGIAYSCMIGWSVMLFFETIYYFITCKKLGLPRKEEQVGGTV